MPGADAPSDPQSDSLSDRNELNDLCDPAETADSADSTVDPASALDRFHPLLRRWFADRLGVPTDVQARSWPEIAAGRHVLVTAPTGSGKTLTAFLWAIDRLLTGDLEGGTVRILYVSPLKALNNDVHRNLGRPLAELSEVFAAAEETMPSIRVGVRSGDTPNNERQRMLRHPPEILITTPESLNILLTSKGGRAILGSIETVILDEVHAVAAGKRGTHLMTAVERLTLLSGEFQRIALSATVKPLEVIARFVGGFYPGPESKSRLESEPGSGGSVEGFGEPVLQPRPVTIIRSRAAKSYQLTVRAPQAIDKDGEAEEIGPVEEPSVWDRIVPEVKEIVRRHRSTLIFANSRRMSERLTRLINEGESRDLAYSHHGSLSREVRATVEERLKAGVLPAIVATNTLELGIDIGTLDEVVMVQTPRSVASAIQRVGRSGHGVGETSRGTLFPSHGRDSLDAAVVARAVLDGDVESMRPVEGPLDVLAQVILSMVSAEPWPVDRLFDFLRTTTPYRRLTRRQLDLVIEMLAGRYADARIRELKPRISIDRVTGTLRARPGAARLIYHSGGTIPDRGYYNLRLDAGDGPGAKLGELDEEFVWERSIGDTFTLGLQSWRVKRVTHNDVIVTQARGGAALAPFWRADRQDRGFHLSERVGRFLEHADEQINDPSYARALEAEHHLEPAAAVELTSFLREQKAATGGKLPHRRRLIVEHVAGTDAGGRRRIVFHTVWGGEVNRPFGMAISAAFEERHGVALEVVHDDDCLMLLPKEGDGGEDFLGLVHPDRLEALLRTKLGATGFFGARFRQNAGRALLLPKAGFGKRMPLWMSRERSKKLLAAVEEYGDFPVVVETWRECLNDEFDLVNLKRLLDRLRAGEIEVVHVRTESPSPFTASLVWQETNRLMYEDDNPETSGPGATLSGDLLRELVYSSRLRQSLDPALVTQFLAKLQRTAVGYAPRTADDLVDWLEERLLVPKTEWRALLEAHERDRAKPGQESSEPTVDMSFADRLLCVRLPGAGSAAVVALPALVRLERALGWNENDSFEVRALVADGQPSATALESLDILRRQGSGDRGLTKAIANGTTDLDGDPWAGLLAEWLRHYGPIEPRLIEDLFGVDSERLRSTIEDLVEGGQVVVDQLVEGHPVEICDAENLEILLRWTRRAARQEFEPVPADRLPLFLATWQGLVEPGTNRGAAIEDLQARLEALLGYSLPARMWESEVLPARLDPYYRSWLDRLLRESDLEWRGAGSGKLLFAFPGDDVLLSEAPDSGGDETLESAPESDSESEGVDSVFPDRAGRWTLPELAQASGLNQSKLVEELWELAWSGRATSDAFDAVRLGIANGFKAAASGPKAGTESRRSTSAGRAPERRGRRVPRLRRAGFDRWQSPESSTGTWRALDEPWPEGTEPDPIERDELARDRARLLLDRYGIVFRELLDRELPSLRWSRVFRALRLMELAGEVLAGHFFSGVSGLQFAKPIAFRRLADGLSDDAIYWLNAVDPASPCGVSVEPLRGRFPARRESNHVVFHGDRLVVSSQRNGGRLEIAVAADHPCLDRYLGVLGVLLSRDFEPRKEVVIEEINGEPAAQSAYRNAVVQGFDAVREGGKLRLRRRY